MKPYTEIQIYRNKSKWNFRKVAVSNLYPKGEIVSSSNQRHSNYEDCYKIAKKDAWYDGKKIEIRILKKYFRIRRK